MRREHLYLNDIIDAIDHIGVFLAGENLDVALDTLVRLGANLPPVPSRFFSRRSIYSRHD